MKSCCLRNLRSPRSTPGCCPFSYFVITALLMLVSPWEIWAQSMPTESMPAQGKGSLRGRLTPMTDHGFLLATARIRDLATEVKVAEDGSFHFDGLRPGSFLLEARVPTLGVISQRVVIRADEVTRVTLALDPSLYSEGTEERCSQN